MFLKTRIHLKKSEMYFEGRDESLNISLDILIIFHFQWESLSFLNSVYSAEELNLFAITLKPSNSLIALPSTKHLTSFWICEFMRQ